MSLKNQIYSDITKCDEVLQARDKIKAEDLVNEIVIVYGNHIKDIHNGVSSYGYGDADADYFKDIHILKRKLEILVADIKDGRYTSMPNKSGLVLNNNHFNSIKNSNSSEITINLEVNFEQIKEDIRNNDSLSSEETQDILERLSQIEEISKSRLSKKEKWSKLRALLSWLGTKGVDIGLKLLPIIISIIKDS